MKIRVPSAEVMRFLTQLRDDLSAFREKREDAGDQSASFAIFAMEEHLDALVDGGYSRMLPKTLLIEVNGIAVPTAHNKSKKRDKSKKHVREHR